MRTQHTLHLRLDAELSDALERFRVAEGLRSGAAAARAAILAIAPPVSGEQPLQEPSPFTGVLTAWAMLYGEAPTLAADALQHPQVELLRGALMEAGYPVPEGAAPVVLGAALRALRGRRDNKGRYLEAQRGRTGVVRWTLKSD